MTPSEFQEFLSHTPKLYHMAEHFSHNMILQHGLLSTSSLLDLFGYDGNVRAAIERQRRSESIPISHPEIGQAVVRDQKPMTDDGLRKCLQDGLSPHDWYRFLNGHVFFWLTEERLQRMLCARPYRRAYHDVFVLDGPSLIQDFRSQILLSPMNSGCTKPFPWPRGSNTLQPVDDYPYRDRKQAGKEGAVEVAVRGGIPNIQDYVIEIQERDCSQIYRRY